jgi:phosphate transport system permease protein
MIYLYLTLILAGFFILKNQKGKNIQKCLNIHYSSLFAIYALITATILSTSIFKNPYLEIIFVSSAIISIASIFLLKKHKFNAKANLDFIIKIALFLCATVGIVITFITLISIISEAVKFFRIVDFSDFVFGKTWNPQIVHYQKTSFSDSFGALPIIAGTLLIAAIAITIAAPLGIMSAIYLVEYAKPKTRNIVKPILEILAGIPTIVYGYFAIIFFTPILKYLGTEFNIDITSESALSAGIVMGIMIIPFVSSLSDDAINSVSDSLRQGSLALGSTKSEMITKVVLLKAMPNISSSILLAISRAIGETMIVVMAAGLSANLTLNPLESVTTATVQIVALLTGDQESESVTTLAAFALSSVLFFITLVLNIIALSILKRSQKYS